VPFPGTGLEHPRSVYVLANGDILIVESKAPPVPPISRPIDLVMQWIKSQTTSSGQTKSNRMTLSRNLDGKGGADTRSIFLNNLNSPFGVALVGSDLYVADTDAIVRYPYKDGDIKMAWMRLARRVGRLFLLMQERVLRRDVSSSERTIFTCKKEEIMKKEIGVLALGAALAFGMVAGAWAQSGGAGGGAGGAGGGAAGTGATGNSSGGPIGGRGSANPPSPNSNPSSPNTVPQSNETPVSPGTSTGNGTH
jgi:hypothetical protein